MYSVQIAVSDGTLTRIALSIEYFEKDDITLYRNLETVPMVLDVDWQWDGAGAINLLTNIPVPNGQYITVRRNTDIDRAFNIYDGGAAFSRATLDENFRQMIYLAQEFTEGNGLSGLFFPLDMHGFQIKNLGDGTDPGDAVNKKQLDVVDQRVTNIEETFVTSTTSYPWYEITTVVKDTFAPPFVFDKAAVYVNGVCQIPGYSYVVVSNQILLAEPVPIGTAFFARLGEDVGMDPNYATAEQLAETISNYQAADAALDAAKADAGANSDITSLSGLTTPLTVTQGGTGNTMGAVATLSTARTFQTDLGSESGVLFDGSSNNIHGVQGILPVSHGGTGGDTQATARTGLGATSLGSNLFTATSAINARGFLFAAQSGSNPDITALTNLSGGITGLVTGGTAAAGVVGEVLGDTAAAATTALTTGVTANTHSLVLTPGEWYVEGAVQLVITSAITSSARSWGISTVSGTLSTNWWDNEVTLIPTSALGAGTASHAAPGRYIRVSTNTTVYLVANVTFTAGTATGRGYLRARRMR